MTPTQLEYAYKLLNEKRRNNTLSYTDYFNNLIELGFKKPFLQTEIKRFVLQGVVTTNEEIKIKILINQL